MKLTIGDVLKHKEERVTAQKEIYWMGELGDRDNFESLYNGTMYDGKTKMGPWANMSEWSWNKYGVGKLGIGSGQKYKKQPDGRWLKVEG